MPELQVASDGRMSWGFVVGNRYNRKADIHGRFGGQIRNGIITPAKFPVIFVMTGKGGRTYGYEDRECADGTFEYYGQGAVGHMKWAAGNAAIRDHSQNGKDLLLFEKIYPGRYVVFRGNYVCDGWIEGRSRDKKGTLRRSFVFKLKRLSDVLENVVDDPSSDRDLERLRELAYAAAGVREGVEQRRTVYERSQAVRDYVLTRANGVCEGCKRTASFLRPNGIPYLEPHHIRRVSDGGPDDPRFVIALCETCHRRVHHGADGTAYNATLLGLMRGIEDKRV